MFICSEEPASKSYQTKGLEERLLDLTILWIKIAINTRIVWGNLYHGWSAGRQLDK